MRLQTWTAASITAISLATAAATAHADDLFRLDAAATSGGALSVSATGSSLPNLIEDAIRTRGSFAAFTGRDAQATVNYAGLSNAIIIDVNAAGTAATLQIPELGFTRNFAGINSDDLQDEVEEFLFRDGQDIYAEFLELVRQRTVIDALDGNPTSVTARLAKGTMRHHTLGPWPSVSAGPALGEFTHENSDGTWPRSNAVFGSAQTRSSFSIRGGDIDGENFDGERIELDAFGEILGERFGISASGFVAYQEIEDSSMGQAGMEIALPIRLIADMPVFDGGALLEVRAVPLLQMGGAGSVDAGSGGSIYGYGGALTARLATESLVFSAGAQSLWFRGIDADGTYDDDDFSFNTQLKQQVLSAGGSLGWRPADWVMLDVGYAYHDYREPAGVSHWASPSAGVSLALDNLALRAGYEADLADRVDSEHLSLSLRFDF